MEVRVLSGAWRKAPLERGFFHAAGAVAANEATHYSFFDAILPGANAVLPAFGPKPITAAKAAATLQSLGFLTKA